MFSFLQSIPRLYSNFGVSETRGVSDLHTIEKNTQALGRFLTFLKETEKAALDDLKTKRKATLHHIENKVGPLLVDNCDRGHSAK